MLVGWRLERSAGSHVEGLNWIIDLMVIRRVREISSLTNLSLRLFAQLAPFSSTSQLTTGRAVCMFDGTALVKTCLCLSLPLSLCLS